MLFRSSISRTILSLVFGALGIFDTVASSAFAQSCDPNNPPVCNEGDTRTRSEPGDGSSYPTTYTEQCLCSAWHVVKEETTPVDCNGTKYLTKTYSLKKYGGSTCSVVSTRDERITMITNLLGVYDCSNPDIGFSGQFCAVAPGVNTDTFKVFRSGSSFGSCQTEHRGGYSTVYPVACDGRVGGPGQSIPYGTPIKEYTHQFSENTQNFECAPGSPACEIGGNCPSTTISCDSSLDGDNTNGQADARSNPDCSISLSQQTCDNYPGDLPSGQIDPNSFCPASPLDCPDTGDSESLLKCIQAVCTLKHELHHTKEGRCQSCETEGNAYETNVQCLSEYMGQHCSESDLSNCSADSTSSCCALNTQRSNAQDRVNFFRCLCRPKPSDGDIEPGDIPYAPGVCEQCAAEVGNSHDIEITRATYCDRFEMPAEETADSFINSQFTPEERQDPVIGGLQSDPDADGLSNLMEYAFNSNPKLANMLQQISYEFINNHFTISFPTNAAASDLTYRIGVKSDLLSPWSYSILGSPDAADAITFSEPTVVNDSAGTMRVTATDKTDKRTVNMRFFKLEVLIDAPVPQAAAISLSSAAPSLYTLSVRKTGSGTVTSENDEISCGNRCESNIIAGTKIVLHAAPADGESFDGWSGACTGSDPTCSVTMNDAVAVTAAFSVPEVILTPVPVPTATVTPISYNDRKAPVIQRISGGCSGTSCGLKIKAKDSGKGASGINSIILEGASIKTVCTEGAKKRSCSQQSAPLTLTPGARSGNEFNYSFTLSEHARIEVTARAVDNAGNRSKPKKFRRKIKI